MANWNDFISLWNDPVATWNDTGAPSTFSPQVEIQLGTTWTNITPYVYYRDSIKVQGGQQDETSQVQAGSCQFTLNNNDGRFSPRKPTGAYYGQIGRNTPVRVSMPTTASYAWMPGLNDVTYTIQSADSAALSVTGDLDVRLEVQLENWHIDNNSISGNTQEVDLAGKYFITGDQRSWYWTIIPAGGMRFGWSTDGTGSTGGFFGSAVPVPIPGDGRIALRVTLDVNNGAGGWTATFYTSDSINGTWTQLDQVVYNLAGTTSIFDSTAPLQVGNITGISYATFGFQPSYGKLFAFEMRNGINGTIVANPDFTNLNEGVTSFTDGSGNPWVTTGQVEVLQREFRFVGEVSSWPATWDTGGFDVYVPITANGILRRLGQGTRPLQSTLRRRLPAFSPLAYWPMEDGSSATQAANAVSGGATMTTSGLRYANDATLPSSAALPTFDSTLATVNLRGTIPAPSSTLTSWKVQQMYYLKTAPVTSRMFMRVLSTGTVVEWQVWGSSTQWNVRGYGSDGTLVVNSTISSTAAQFGQWNSMRLDLSVSAGTVTSVVSWIDVTGNNITSTTIYSGAVGHPTAYLSPSGGFSSDLDGMVIGHVTAFPTNTVDQYINAMNAYTGERATERMVRLANEESLQVSAFGRYIDEEQVGPQTQQTFLALCQEAAAADGGILYERRNLTGLGFRNRATLDNQGAALTVSYTNSALVAPLQPTGDDFLIRNDVTVSRINGSSATETDTTSPLSVNPPPSGVGDYSVQYTLGLYDDSRLDLIAGWQLHLGTWDEERYPVVNLALHNDTTLVPSVLAMNVGDRLVITNPPSWLAPQPIDLMVIGYSETFDQFTWYLSLVCVPYGPWHVATADDVTYGRADTAGSSLAADATSAATSLSVATTSGPLWTTSAGDFPFDVTIGGEQVTVTNVTGSSSPQTFTVTRSVNGVVKAQTSGTVVDLHTPAYTAL